MTEWPTEAAHGTVDPGLPAPSSLGCPGAGALPAAEAELWVNYTWAFKLTNRCLPGRSVYRDAQDRLRVLACAHLGKATDACQPRSAFCPGAVTPGFSDFTWSASVRPQPADLNDLNRPGQPWSNVDEGDSA
jgi:hypothetical protein